MAKYGKKNKTSEQTQTEALAVARRTQKPGQTKEQTKLIAQGIQKGIESYKKQQKSKARELDKRLKSAAASGKQQLADEPVGPDSSQDASKPMLPWLLLALSWLVFIAYLMMER